MIKKKNSSHLKQVFVSFLLIVVLECVVGHYGYNCNETCGQCMDPKQCSAVSGTCLTGCRAGYVGRLCKEGRWFVDFFQLKNEVIWFYISLKKLICIFICNTEKICIILFEFRRSFNFD